MVVARSLPGVEELLESVAAYLPTDRAEAVSHALDAAVEYHGDQQRLSGKPYVTHPIAVAGLVASLHMDATTLQAALLHDVIEDCGV